MAFRYINKAHINPSEVHESVKSELAKINKRQDDIIRFIRHYEEEQAEAMKRYIREVFIPEYAKNFNKELSALDIKFYGKIQFDRYRSNNKLNMHCYLIVSRKDQSNKKNLSPLTNHKDTKSGVIKGGFDCVNLFQQAEQGFDKLFDYNRQHSESFDYHNKMKNGSISEQLELQAQTFIGKKKKEIFKSSEKENNISCNLDSKVENKHSNNQQNNNGSDSLLSTFSLEVDFTLSSTLLGEQKSKPQKKKQRKPKR